MMKEFRITKELVIHTFLFKHRAFDEMVIHSNMKESLDVYLKKIKNKQILKSIELSILDKVLLSESKAKLFDTKTNTNYNMYKCTIQNKVFTCVINVLEIDNDKKELLIWLKEQMLQNEIIEFPEIEGFTLTVVDGIAYGNVTTIVHWRNHLPKNSWEIVSDEPIPVRPTTNTSTSLYDPEYMREYYQVKKVEKYRMKIKIQTEAYKLGMPYGKYRREFYPNFTFRDEKVKFSINTNDMNVNNMLNAYSNLPI